MFPPNNDSSTDGEVFKMDLDTSSKDTGILHQIPVVISSDEELEQSMIAVEAAISLEPDSTSD